MTYQGNIHGAQIPQNIQAQFFQNHSNLANIQKNANAHQIPVHHAAYANAYAAQQNFAHNTYRGVVPQNAAISQMPMTHFDKAPQAQQQLYNFTLLDKLSSQARLRALAKLIDPDIELEDEAVEVSYFCRVYCFLISFELKLLPSRSYYRISY